MISDARHSSLFSPPDDKVHIEEGEGEVNDDVGGKRSRLFLSCSHRNLFSRLYTLSIDESCKEETMENIVVHNLPRMRTAQRDRIASRGFSRPLKPSQCKFQYLHHISESYADVETSRSFAAALMSLRATTATVMRRRATTAASAHQRIIIMLASIHPKALAASAHMRPEQCSHT